MSDKQTIRLTESQFHQVVKATVKRFLKESTDEYETLYDSIQVEEHLAWD